MDSLILEKKVLQKQKSHAFGKDVYLLGQDAEGTKYWLEAASWDCDWYWGFGYVETYTNNNDPSRAKDIHSHQHFEGLWMKDEDGLYLNKLSDWKGFESTLSEEEEWMLSELMQNFYTLKEAASLLWSGTAGQSTVDGCKEILTRKGWVNEINEIMLPAIFEKIYALLNPTI